MMISPLCVIEPQAKLGNNVTVEPFTKIYGDVEIGDDCWIGPNVTIFDGARIGKGVKIFPGAVISGIPQDLKYKGEKTTTIIGDYTTIRECVTINKGTAANWETKVGSHTLLMAYSHVAHDCIVGNHCILANSATLAGHITVHDYAIIGGLCAIHQFVTIGAHTLISGGSLVRKDVPPYTRAAREPLAYVGINSIGLRRRSFPVDAIKIIQDSYRILFASGLSVSDAIQEIESEIPGSEYKDQILIFIKTSKRGLMKGYMGKDPDEE
jgi:UDP-N-acetylglucosamine acyltransferase